MSNLPIYQKTINVSEPEDEEDFPRGHIGYSHCGDPCARSLWYGLHWMDKKTVSARQRRIFDTGHNSESMMYDHLAQAGIKIFDKQKEVIGPYSHVLGHIDGLCSGIEGDPESIYLLELKTMNQARFTACVGKGVYFSDREYYLQAQGYMGKLGILKTLFVFYNKNNSSYHYEVIDFDEFQFELLQAKLTDVLFSEFAPDRIGDSKWFECKICDFFDICQGDKQIQENCRTCRNCSIEDDGKWSCDFEKDEKMLPIEAQKNGCRKWEQIKWL